MKLKYIFKNKNQSNSLKITSNPNTTLDNFIHVFDDVLSAKLCDQIIKEYEDSNSWVQSVTALGENNKVRNCQEISISNPNIISQNELKRQNIDNLIFESISQVVNKYKEFHPLVDIEIDTGYQLLKYNKTQFYTQHTDSFKDQQRSLSCSIQLNDDYDGGDFAFFDRELIIKRKKGSAIVFPSNFMYPHEIMPVKKGIRYSIVTWFV